MEKKLIASVLSASLLCVIHDATVKNSLFENDSGANMLFACNPTQVFLHLKKKSY